MAAASRGAEWTSLLEKLSLERAEKLLNELGENLSGVQPRAPLAEDYGELTPEDFERSTRALRDLFKNLCLSPPSSKSTRTTSNGDGNGSSPVPWERLSSPYKEKVRQVILRHEEGLRLRFLKENELPRQALAHFDWEAEVVVGSSSLASQETPLLRLTLGLQTADSESCRNIAIEMQRGQLCRTIEELEACLEDQSPGDVSSGTLKTSEMDRYANGEIQTADD
ncbi:hypothetical protein BIW11_08853 [Tropilaelaps mercedesae]|uniref:COMM domain-containing protein n=1 Tax=Tropilaelaps mercedesae TaxID=418985 RepID=A0A1V9XN49_9ACAR|nr:hypothetical protein BIW11_08853 [Tropilaelaps mercedesae]